MHHPDPLALVTGATSGFGAAITRRLIADGYRVIGTGRRRDRLDALAAELGERFLPCAFDLRDRAATEAAVAALPPGWQAITALVNNAGLALGLEPAWRADLDDWETMIQTNVQGLVTITRAVLPGMVERGAGHVVLISSAAATRPYPGANVYGASKAFVSQLGDNLRADLTGHPIRVTTLEPGLCDTTEFSLVRFKGDADRARTPYQGVQALTDVDIAEAVSWVLGLPAHVNINRMELMPVMQSFGALPVARKG